MPRSGAVARRYAEAAFEVATEEAGVERWSDELARAAEAYADPRVGEVLRDPSLNAGARREVLQRVLVQPLSARVLNLVTLLIQRRLVDLLPAVASEFQRLVDRRDGVTPAIVASAAPLTPGEMRELNDRLVQLTAGPVRVTTEVDPGLIGGVTVRLGDRLFDGSVRGRLERLRGRLASGAL